MQINNVSFSPNVTNIFSWLLINYLDKGNSMKYDFKAAIDIAVQPTNDLAMQLVLKVVTNGFPKGIIGRAMWGSCALSRQPTEVEIAGAAYVADLIRSEAKRTIARLFLVEGFSAALKKDMLTGHNRKMATDRHSRRSSLFMKFLQADTGKSTKQLLKELEEAGQIIDEGDSYLIVDDIAPRDSWERIRKMSVDSKVSRLRTKLAKLHNT